MGCAGRGARAFHDASRPPRFVFSCISTRKEDAPRTPTVPSFVSRAAGNPVVHAEGEGRVPVRRRFDPHRGNDMKRLLVLLSLITLTLGASEGFAQGRTVSGRVTSTLTNGPLSGVLVEVQGTSTSTRTDTDGRYRITAPATSTALRFSAPQHDARIVSITGDVVNVQLSSQGALAMEGVVVTALGIERAERTLGVATTTVVGEALSRTEPNLINSLSGRVPGVNITNAGPQGGSARIVIRGEKSVTGNNQPLFVVDGVPVDNYGTGAWLNTGQGGYDYGNAVQDIDPGSIETITVLKGPNAAALYGSRASNGVVLITTKNGRTATARGPEIIASQDVTFDDEL